MGVTVQQTLTQNARVLRKNMTDAERSLWSVLRLRQQGGHRFRRQFPIGRYIVDFVCLDARLIVEVDGGQHSENTGDLVRDDWLRSQHFNVLRFWNNDVLSNLEGVSQAIESALMQASPPSQPSPLKGEGAPLERHAST